MRDYRVTARPVTLIIAFVFRKLATSRRVQWTLAMADAGVATEQHRLRYLHGTRTVLNDRIERMR